MRAPTTKDVRKLVNREEEGKRIAQTSGAISISMNQIIHNALNTNNQATGQIVANHFHLL